MTISTGDTLPDTALVQLGQNGPEPVALADKTPAKVIGETGKLRDKPGFEVDLITRASATDAMHSHDRPSVLMPVKGHWRVDWQGGTTVLAPGDTMSVPENLEHRALPSMSGEAALYHVVATGDPVFDVSVAEPREIAFELVDIGCEV